MSRDQYEAEFALFEARASVEFLKQELSDVVHLLFNLVMQAASPAGLSAETIRVLIWKRIREDQSSIRVWEDLAQLDDQLGRPLSARGILLDNWIEEWRSDIDAVR